tara:strand:- start:413 stop:865 length:453 start_codon:yes stop_codon:yes gene_type:complete
MKKIWRSSMPRCMHLVPGLTSLNTKKAKVKITKKRMLELKEEHRLHNKKYKHDKMLAHIMVMTFDNYIKWRFGKLKFKPKSRGEYIPTTTISITPRTETPKMEPHKGTKPNDDYKREISSQYVIGQAYNKSGLQVLTKKETQDPATGKRR